MKSFSVTIHVEAIERYFPAVLYITVLYNLVQHNKQHHRKVLLNKNISKGITVLSKKASNKISSVFQMISHRNDMLHNRKMESALSLINQSEPIRKHNTGMGSTKIEGSWKICVKFVFFFLSFFFFYFFFAAPYRMARIKLCQARFGFDR